MAKQSRQRGAVRPNSAPPTPSPDSAAQQQAARAMLWLLALLGAAIVAGGLWMLSTAAVGGKLMPLKVGLGAVIIALGAACCWAGMYAAAHSTLKAGRLRFDDAAYDLVNSARFQRMLKYAGHAVGITVLASSWLSFYYPEGLPFR